MADIIPIIVNDKTYKVQKLEVLDTIYFHAEVLHSMGDMVGLLLDFYFRLSKEKENEEKVDIKELGPILSKTDPEAIKKFAPLVFKQVITPTNKFLNDAPTVEEWFSQDNNKADVWPVLIKASGIILGEYLPDFLKGLIKIKKKEEPAK
jgi:hypothetical protein